MVVVAEVVVCLPIVLVDLVVVEVVELVVLFQLQEMVWTTLAAEVVVYIILVVQLDLVLGEMVLLLLDIQMVS